MSKPEDMQPSQQILPPIPLTIQQRIVAVMSEVSYLQKDSEISTGGGKYRAITYDKLIHALQPQFVKHGILFYYDIEDWKAEDIPTRNGTTNRTSCEVRCVLLSSDAKGLEHAHGYSATECVQGVSLGYGQGNDDKGPGKAVTYAVKAWLLKTFALQSGDDPDQHSGEYDPPKSKKDRVEALYELADGGKDEVTAYIKNLMGPDDIPDTVADITEVALEEAECHFTKIPEA